MYTNQKNHIVYFYYRSYTYFLFLILLRKKCQTRFIFVSKGLLDQISIARCFIISAPEFERAFGRANCRSLSEHLLLIKHSQSGSNLSIAMFTVHSSRFRWKVHFALLRQQPYIQKRKSTPTYKLNTLTYAEYHRLDWFRKSEAKIEGFL